MQNLPNNVTNDSMSGLTSSIPSDCVNVLRYPYVASPINTLPIELLIQTFEIATLQDHFYDFGANHIPNPLANRVIVAEVCSLWRTIALNCGRLWLISIYDEPSDRIQLLWLSRSKVEPITLYLNLQDASWVRRDTIGGLMEALLLHKSRVHALCIYGTAWSISPTINTNSDPTPLIITHLLSELARDGQCRLEVSDID